MTAAWDPAEARRLVAQLREDDARMTPAPWFGRSRFLSRVPDSSGVGATMHGNHLANLADPDDAAGCARLRNNAKPLADQLEAAAAEIERLTGKSSQLAAERDHALARVTAQVEIYNDERAANVELGEERDRLHAEVERLRPVVEAAEEESDRAAECTCDDYGSWNSHLLKCPSRPSDEALSEAVDAYRSRKP